MPFPQNNGVFGGHGQSQGGFPSLPLSPAPSNHPQTPSPSHPPSSSPSQPLSPPMSPLPSRPMVPQLILDLQVNEVSDAEQQHRLRCVTDHDIAVFEELSLMHDQPSSAAAATSTKPVQVDKKLLRTFCKICDQKLFLLVEWARKASFFKALKVSLGVQHFINLHCNSPMEQ